MSDNDWPCHSKPRDQWCDSHGPGGFMGHTCHIKFTVALTLEEKLVLLMEECGEVVQAASKCLRFGYNHDEPGYGVNSEMLAKEVGDLTGVVHSLYLDQQIVERFAKDKIHKAQRAKAQRANKAFIQPHPAASSPRGGRDA